jgi:hypothetical protein
MLSRGWCNAHYQQWWRRGNPCFVKIGGRGDQRPFWEKVDKSGYCWVWTLKLDRTGYGRTFFRRRLWLAHRVAYTLAKGDIPEGLTLDHLCRNRACVNPDHLEAVSMRVNTQRGDGGKHFASKTHCPKGHPYSGQNLGVGPNGHVRYCKTCKREKSRAWMRVNRYGKTA